MCQSGHNHKRRPGSMCGFAQRYTSSWKNRYPVIDTCVCCMSFCVFNMYSVCYLPNRPQDEVANLKGGSCQKENSTWQEWNREKEGREEGKRGRTRKQETRWCCAHITVWNNCFFIANIGTVNQRFAMYPLCSSSAEDHLTLTDLCRLKKAAMCPWRAAAPCCRCCHRIRSEAGRDLCDTSGVCSAAQLSSR